MPGFGREAVGQDGCCGMRRLGGVNAQLTLDVTRGEGPEGAQRELQREGGEIVPAAAVLWLNRGEAGFYGS